MKKQKSAMINILDIKENKDGSATIDVGYTKELEILIKNHYKRKRFSKKLLNKFIIEGLV